MHMKQYTAGVCNIGLKNRLARILFGIALLGITLAASAYLKGIALPRMAQFILIIPLYFSFLGIWQGFFGFCVMHARNGTFDLR